MSAILAMITAAVLIVYSLFHEKRTKGQVTQALVRRFVHPGHAWARTTEDGHIVVGIDEFAQSVIGSIREVKLPRLLSHVRQGRPAWVLVDGNRKLPIVSPISGWVIEKNEAVLHNPSLVNVAPYGEGWLVKIKAYHLQDQLRNMFAGRVAYEWQDSARSRLARFFSGTPALMYQDGGTITTDLAERCSNEEWKKLVREFFLVE
ncbi:MAG: glycine cleavage system protein H [Ignavibacteria bacterium]|nr:glycine cleavage system protein H [Ignavibacteria bacterium]